ncbi:NAD(+) synthase, partial [Lachnotalea glycerini]
AATPEIRVADCEYNRIAIEAEIDKALSQKAKLIVFPELVLTGYTCSDLFLQEQLLIEAKKQLIELAKYSKGKDILIFVGLPYERKAKLYNVTAAILNGEILGFIPKSHIPTYSEFYELRHFTKGNEKPVTVMINEKEVLFGTNLLFECINMDGFVIAGEICEDVWVPNPPSIRHAMAGATVIINSSASDET